MKPNKLISFGILITLLSGCFVSTMSKDWDIVWDEKKVDSKNSFLSSNQKSTVDNRPNVIVIIADDLGKYEVSGYGATDIQTPNIDRIGKNGVQFKDAYVTAPICAPSRASILTGRYQQRFGFETQPMEFYPTNKVEFNTGKKSKKLGDWKITAEPSFPTPWMVERQGVPPDEINMAELFQSSGYHTGLIGKWHLGHGEEHIPNNRGFDYQYGFYGAFSLYTPEQKTPGYVNFIQDDLSAKHQWNMKRNSNAAIRENNTVVDEQEYLTFALKNKAKTFITNNKDDNFLLYLSFNAPHVPFQAPQEYYDKFSHITDENRRVYLAMISALDDAIGDLMNHLEEQNLTENTIVYFISDNGGASYTGATTNGPLKGGKITHFEGGINVPFMMQWPGKIEPGIVFENPVSAMDIFTTSLVACRINPPPNTIIDGQDLIPFITELKNGQPHEKLYWRTDHIRAIRYKKWKLILSTRDNWMHIYNLENDKFEKIDLKDFNSEEKQVLLDYFESWNKELPTDYLWPRIMDRKFIIGDNEYYFPA